MPVVILDGSTVRDFVEDKEAFASAMEIRFKETDLDNDGTLSRAELRTAFEKMRLLESHFGMPEHKTPEELSSLYDSVFEKFDSDRDGRVDFGEFCSQMKDILLAIAAGLGSSPIQVAIDDDGILQDAVNHEEHELEAEHGHGHGSAAP
jgi:hypothetical protein